MNGEDKVVLNHEVPLLAMMKRYHYFLNKQTEHTKKKISHSTHSSSSSSSSSSSRANYLEAELGDLVEKRNLEWLLCKTIGASWLSLNESALIYGAILLRCIKRIQRL